MVIAVRTEEAEGGLVVVKEARSDGDVARLTREAAMLARCRHPGVVDLLGVDERAIRLRHAGTALARLGPFPLDHAAGSVCAVADVVHALHRLDVVHGDLEAAHVLLDERGRPRLCGFGMARDRTADGAADDVAAIGRLLGSLLRAGADLPWANPPSGVRRSARQRQARKDLDAIVAQATRERRDQRLTARQLAKAVHAAVPECSLPTPRSASPAAPWFAELPADVDPTADLGWTDDDLSWLAAVADDDRNADELDADAGPYAGLGSLDQLADDGSDDDWAALAAAPEAVTGPLPVFTQPDEGPRERARIEHEAAAPPPPPGPSVALPERRAHEEQRRRLPLLRAAVLLVVLAVGVVGGVAGARAVRPLGSDPVSAADATTTTSAPSPTAPDQTATSTTAAPAARPWPSTCTVPEPTGPDADGDGCPEEVVLDGRTARIGTVTVELGQDGDLVALGDWHCTGIATPALLRPDTGEVFVFPEWRLDEPVEVEAVTSVPGATAIVAGSGGCPSPVLTTPDGPRTVEVDG